MAGDTSPSGHWSGTGQMRGGTKGIGLFIWIIRALGLLPAYLLAVPCTIYFSFVSPDVDSTMDYHRRVFRKVPWWKRRWLVFKHFFAFGRAVIDRIAILAGRKDRFTFFFDGEHHVRNALAEGNGLLLLTAHVGNWEVAGQMIARLDVPVNVTGFDNETSQMRDLLNRFSRQKFKLIPLTGSPTDTLALVAALKRGEIVAMLGDRAYGSPATPLPFLGDTAHFPIGAYVMAAIANAPLIHVFSLREAGGHYHFFGFPPERPHMPPRPQRDAYLNACARRFADNLQFVLKRDPLQWYNFYPFWKPPEPPKAPLAKSVE